MGAVLRAIGKKVAGVVCCGLGLCACIYIMVLYYSKAHYGAEWFLAYIYYSFALGMGLIIQYSVMVSHVGKLKIRRWSSSRKRWRSGQVPSCPRWPPL